MRRGKTESGFEFEIDEKKLNDMRFMELLRKAQADSLVFPEVLERMLGEDQKEKLYEHLEDENGYVPIDATVDIITEIMTLAGEDTKNS